MDTTDMGRCYKLGSTFSGTASLPAHHAALTMFKEKEKNQVKEAPPQSDITYVISLLSPSPSLHSSQNGQRPVPPLAWKTRILANADTEPNPPPSQT